MKDEAQTRAARCGFVNADLILSQPVEVKVDPRLVVADRNDAKATLQHASARRISTAISLDDCVGQVSLRDPGLENLKTDPLLDPLRKEPRFKAIERELRFPN